MATRTDRLAEIVRLLWEKREFGASAQEIGKSLGLKSRTYLTNLLKELINEGVAVAQQNIAGRGALYYAAHSSIKKVAGIASPTPAYFPIDAWIFDNDHCFLCGILLNMQNRTEEHVFPRWLQKRYNLSNERLTLQNGTSIPYRQLTIPCCQTCNRDYLSPLEQTIQNAHDRGFAAFSKLPRLLVFQWLAKIYYGILFRELSLLHDRSDPSLGFIFSQDQLKDFGTLHHFLQSVRLPFVFRGFQPWSIFLLKTISFNDQRNFDYKDSLVRPVFCLRMGEIGILATLEDSGIHEVEQEMFFEDIAQLELHPIQFDEAVAYLTYSSLLMTRTPTYLISVPYGPQDPTIVTCTPIMGLSRKPLFREWDNEAYSRILHAYWGKYGVDLTDIYQPPNLVRTVLFDDDGKLIQMNNDGKLLSKLNSKFRDT